MIMVKYSCILISIKFGWYTAERPDLVAILAPTKADEILFFVNSVCYGATIFVTIPTLRESGSS